MKATTKAAFFEAHPLCCFCGGREAATSIDHQPARVFFRSKRMPDNSLFPSCASCQSISREAEAAMSLIVLPGTQADADHAAWLTRVQSAYANRPALLADVVPSEELAAGLRSQISAPPIGYTGEDFITLDPEVWDPHFSMLARKLTLAMHYRFMGRPLGPHGRLLAWLVPNAHHDPEWDEMFEGVGIKAASVYHGSEDLRDQMNLKYQAQPEQGTMAVRLRMHEAMTIYGITAENGADSRLAEISDNLGRPFGPQVEAVPPNRPFSITDLSSSSRWKIVVD